MLKKLNKIMSRLLGAPARVAARYQRTPPRFRPGIECLEDRLVPAVINVTTFADVVNPNDKVISLREAINMANATPGADTIVLRAGTYQISLAGLDDNNAGGDFDVTHSLTIVGQGAGRTIIDGNSAGSNTERIFEVFGASDMVFSNLTLRNGGAGQVPGGAVEAVDANITLNNVVATGNNGARGGVINAENGNVTLNNSSLLDNFAQGSGGGIWAGKGNVTLNGGTFSGNQGANGGAVFARDGKVTATNSTFANNDAFDQKGGAIFALNGNVLATGSIFTANSAINGGAIDAENGNVSLVRDTLQRNQASEDGGAVRAPVGTVSLQGSTLRLNTAGQNLEDAPGGRGGAVFAANANVSTSTISGNIAFTAGGGVFATSTIIVTSSTVSGNQARLLGGGGLLAPAAFVFSSTISGNTAGGGVGGGINAANLTMNNSTVSGNSTTAGGGGGIAAAVASLTGSTISGNTASGGAGGGINASTLNMTNCTVSGNSEVAGFGGGGVFAARGTFLNSTIADNFSAGNGGGVLWAGGADHIHVKNTIIADNLVLTIPPVGQDVSGDFISDGHNLIGVFNGSTGFGAVGDLLGNVGHPLDPKLGALQFNGGPTQTMALLSGSPAIDHGDNSGAPSTDQRGVSRPRDGSGHGVRVVDIGALQR